jgi:pyruvate dehydrogenase E1 component beta subunit
MRKISYAQAGMEAIIEEMTQDATTFHLATSAPVELVNKFGPERVRATPIAEGAFTGIAIGAAGSGYRPIINWGMVTFSFVAMDGIVNQASKIHYMFGGQAKFPITFRASVGGGRRLAAQHSQSPYSMFMNLAGLKMVLPSTPYDMKGLLKSAIRDDNPVISFESSRLMEFQGEVPDEDYTVPLGVADTKREGSDVTVVALAWLVHEALVAAEVLEREGVSVEVIDLRSLVPMDCDAFMRPCRKQAGWSLPTKPARPQARPPKSPLSPPSTARPLRSSKHP